MFGRKRVSPEWSRRRQPTLRSCLWPQKVPRWPEWARNSRYFCFQIHQIKHKFCNSNAPHVSSGTNNGEDVPEGGTGTASPHLSIWEYVDDPLPPVRHKFYSYLYNLKCNLGDRVMQSWAQTLTTGTWECDYWRLPHGGLQTDGF